MLAGVITGYFLSKTYGLNGMIIPIVSALFVNIIITNFYFVRVFQFRVLLFFKNTFLFLLYNYIWASKPLNLSINAYIYSFGETNEASLKLQ